MIIIKTKIIFGLIVLLVIGVALALIFPDKIKSILIGSGGILAALFAGNKAIKKKSDEVKRQQKDINKNVDKIEKDRKNRKEKANDMSKKLRDKDKNFKDTFFSIVLIFFLVFYPVTIRAVENQPIPEEFNKQDLKIPDNYSDLLDSYYQMFEYAMFYRDMAYEFESLYNEESKDANSLNADIKRLNELINTQQKMIDKLLDSDSGLGVEAGINYVPLNPVNSGVVFTVGYEF